jgi:hypothetical protein
MERSYQVGEGGMMVTSRTPLSVGENAVVSFFLEDFVSPIMARAVVRSIVPAADGRPERYGMEFLNLEFQWKRRIRNFVAAAPTD